MGTWGSIGPLRRVALAAICGHNMRAENTGLVQRIFQRCRDRARQNKTGPNAPCPCGSGKKHKKCCGRV